MKHECKNLVMLSSMNKKICPDCGKEYEWNLEQDQKPLLGCNRSTRYIAPRKATRVEINKEALVVSAFFDEERMDIIGQNGNDGVVYMCGDRWLETGSPWGKR